MTDILSTDAENANYLLSLFDNIKRSIFLRRWAHLAGKNINKKQNSSIKKFLNPDSMRYKMLEPIFEKIENIKQEINDEKIEENEALIEKNSEIQDEEKNQKQISNNLCFGDIVYFKAYINQQNSSFQKSQRGVIAGDGIASNKLECIPQNTIGKQNDKESAVMTKNSQLMFRKSLFQVVDTKKYYYNKLLKKAKSINVKQSIIEELQRKADEEEQENIRVYERNKGQNIIYGQEVQLKHIYSNTTLTLNIDVLAHQNCCREMSLEEDPSEYSNFIFQSVNRSKQIGEPIFYGDQIEIQSGVNLEYWLNINNTVQALEHFEKGLEVNSSDQKIPLKICSFMNFDQEKQHQEKFSIFLQHGNIVRFENRITKTRLSIKKKKPKKLHIRKIQFEGDQNSQPVEMLQEYYNPDTTTKDIQEQYQIYLDPTMKDDNIASLWEIQKQNSFNCSVPSFYQKFRLKNVVTGLYLYLDQGKLSLKYNGDVDQCLFYIVPKKSSNNVQNIGFNQQVKITAIDLGEVCLLYSLEKIDKELINKFHNLIENQKVLENEGIFQVGDSNLKQKLAQMDSVCFIRKSLQNKKKQGRSLFDIVQVEGELRKIADRVSSLYPQLFNFYTYLQDWGLEYNVNLEFPVYTHKKAFESQKELSNNVRQLNQALQNLEMFLDVDDQSQLRYIQKILMENGVLNILIQILKLCHFFIYGNPVNKQKQDDNFGIGIYKNKEINERSAQKIVQSILHQQQAIKSIYELLQKMIKSNSKCCSSILSQNNNYLQFFISQIEYYPEEIKALLIEAVQYLDEEEDKELSNLENWVDKIRTLTEDNIEIQTFFIELLTLSLKDSQDRPFFVFQNFIRKKLFGSVKMNKQKYIDKQPIINFALLKFELNDDKPVASFNFDQENSNPKKWSDDNLTLYDLARKAIESGKAVDKSSKFQNQEIDDHQFIDFYDITQVGKWNKYEMGLLDGTIEQIIGKRNTGTLAKYENYVISVLNLYSSLCKGRNKKMIQIVQSNLVNLTPEFVKKAIDYFIYTLPNENSKFQITYNLRFYTVLLELYDILILDRQPLIRINDYTNKCFVIQDLKDFDTENHKTYNIFKQFTLNKQSQELAVEEMGKNSGKFVHKDKNNMINEMAQHDFVRQYADFIVLQEDPDKIKWHEDDLDKSQDLSYSNKLIAQFLSDKQNHKIFECPQQFNVNDIFQKHKKKQEGGHNKDEIIQNCLKAFLFTLKLIRSKLELGYFDKETIQLVSQKLYNIFLGYMLFIQNQEDQEEGIEKEEFQDSNFSEIISQNWICQFIFKNFKELEDSPQKQMLITKIMVETIYTFGSIQRLLLELDILNKIQDNQSTKMENAVYYNTIKNMSDQYKNTEKQDNYDDNIDQYEESDDQKIYQKILSSVLIKCSQNAYLSKALIEAIIYTFNIDQLKLDMIDKIEIIDDEYELSLFREVNGTKGQTKSPMEVRYLMQKSVLLMNKIIKEQDDEIFDDQLAENMVDFSQELGQQNPQQQNEKEIQVQKTKSLFKYYNEFLSTLQSYINMFALTNFEKEQNEGNLYKPRKMYIFQLQNIFRNADIHSILLSVLEQVEIQKFQNREFLPFFELLVQFFELFVNENPTNKKIMVPYFTKLMQLPSIPYDIAAPSEQDENDYVSKNRLSYSQIKISDLCKSILADIKLEQGELIQNQIDLIFQKITENSPFLEQEVHSAVTNFQKKMLTLNKIDISKSMAVLQYLKILRSLCIDKKTKTQLKQNQKKILKIILRDQLMIKLAQPIQEYNLKNTSQRFSTQKEFLKLKLHYSTIQLMTDSCKNDRLGIQELQRFIMFDSLKNTLINQESPYLLKRAYIRCLFEIYINKVYDNQTQEFNETISSQEISDIISGEIIPQLDPTNIYSYIEGILRKNKKDQGDTVFDLRKVIIKEKIVFFQKFSNYKSLTQKDDIRLNQGEHAMRQYRQPGVIFDSNEYWRYLFKEGLIHFILDSFDQKQDELDSNDQISSNLLDDFSLTKINLIKLRQLLNIIETNFIKGRGEIQYFDEYRSVINQVKEQIPAKKISKLGMNFRITSAFGNSGKNEVVEKYQSQDQDLFSGNLGDNLDDDFMREDSPINNFIRGLKRFLIRNRIDVDYFYEIIANEKQNHKMIEKALYYVINKEKKYINLKDIQEFCKNCQIKQREYKDGLRLKDDFTDNNLQKLKLQLKNCIQNSKQMQQLYQQQPLDQNQIVLMDDQKEEEEQKDNNNKNKINNNQNENISQIDYDYQSDSNSKKQLLASENQFKYSQQNINVGGKNQQLDEVNMQHVRDQIELNLLNKITKSYINQRKELSKNSQIEDDYMEQDCKKRLLRDYQILNLLQSYLQDNQVLQMEPYAGDNIEIQDTYLEQISLYFTILIEDFKAQLQDNTIYLLKIIRLYMQAKAPEQSDIESLKSEDEKLNHQGKAKLKTYQKLQKCCLKQNLHIIALKTLSKQNSTFEEQFEALTLLIYILYLGNIESQQTIFNLLKQEDRQLCINFFTYLREFFLQDLHQQAKKIAFLKREQEIQKQKLDKGEYFTAYEKARMQFIQNWETEFEILAKLILKLLQQMCENVNKDFQIFMRDQTSKKDSQQIVSTNIILQVSTFLCFLLENEDLALQEKDELICVSLDALNEFCTGHIENQKIVCNNKRLILFINNIILKKQRNFNQMTKQQKEIFLKWSELDLKAKKIMFDEVEEFEKQQVAQGQVSPNELKNYLKNKKERDFYESNINAVQNYILYTEQFSQDINMFASSIKFLLVMMTGNQDEDSINLMISSIDIYYLLQTSRDIYEGRVKPQIENVELERICECNELQDKLTYNQDQIQEINNGVSYKICRIDFCRKGYLTDMDNKIIETGFNIYIFFSYLSNSISLEEQALTMEQLKTLKLFQFKVDELNVELRQEAKNVLCGCFKDPKDQDDDDNSEQEDEDDEDLIIKKKNQRKKAKNRVHPDKTLFSQTIFQSRLEEQTPGMAASDFYNVDEQEQDLNNKGLIMKEIKSLSQKEKKLYQLAQIGNLEQNNKFIPPTEIEKEKLLKNKKKIDNQNQSNSTRKSRIQKKDHFFKFYKKYIGTTEIADYQSNKIYKVYFQKPFISKFLTAYVKDHLIFEADRDSNQERIHFLLQNFQSYYDQMNDKQDINKRFIRRHFVNNWRSIKSALFYVNLLICILILCTQGIVNEEKYTKFYDTLNVVESIVTYISSILACIVLISCARERYSISIAYDLGFKNTQRLGKFKENAGFQPNYLQKQVYKFQGFLTKHFEKDKIKKSFWKKALLIIIDHEFVYNLLYLAINLLAFYSQYFYFVLLLDIIKKFKDLSSVLQAIWQNGTQLLKFTLLGCAVMYIYAIIGWEQFKTDFQEVGDPTFPEYSYDKSFVQLVFYVIKEGVRMGGGITEAMAETTEERDNFWARYAYDISFFIIINMLFIQMIFGIIIDTFGDLREANSELKDKIENICYVCGLERNLIDQLSEEDMGWYHHIYLEHNVYHLLYYMIYVSRKHENECDHLEKYVKQNILENKIDFVPIGYSLTLGEEYNQLELNDEDQQDNEMEIQIEKEI